VRERVQEQGLPQVLALLREQALLQVRRQGLPSRQQVST
jgi:hypothetical protein